MPKNKGLETINHGELTQLCRQFGYTFEKPPTRAEMIARLRSGDPPDVTPPIPEIVVPPDRRTVSDRVNDKRAKRTRRECHCGCGTLLSATTSSTYATPKHRNKAVQISYQVLDGRLPATSLSHLQLQDMAQEWGGIENLMAETRRWKKTLRDLEPGEGEKIREAQIAGHLSIHETVQQFNVSYGTAIAIRLGHHKGVVTRAARSAKEREEEEAKCRG